MILMDIRESPIEAFSAGAAIVMVFMQYEVLQTIHVQLHAIWFDRRSRTVFCFNAVRAELYCGNGMEQSSV